MAEYDPFEGALERDSDLLRQDFHTLFYGMGTLDIADLHEAAVAICRANVPQGDTIESKARKLEGAIVDEDYEKCCKYAQELLPLALQGYVYSGVTVNSQVVYSTLAFLMPRTHELTRRARRRKIVMTQEQWHKEAQTWLRDKLSPNDARIEIMAGTKASAEQKQLYRNRGHQALEVLGLVSYSWLGRIATRFRGRDSNH